jgi:transposase-like protein
VNFLPPGASLRGFFYYWQREVKMGRKSSLTAEQWIEIERRHLVDGVSINALAVEFGVNESSVRRRIKPGKATSPSGKNPLHTLAEEKVRVDAQSKRVSEQIAQLPYANQVLVSDLARKLTNISEHLGSAAELSAASAHRLSRMANQQMEKVDDVNPMSTASFLQSHAVLQKMANCAMEGPLKLLGANKDMIEDLNRRESDQSSLINPARGTVFKIVRPA